MRSLSLAILASLVLAVAPLENDGTNQTSIAPSDEVPDWPTNPMLNPSNLIFLRPSPSSVIPSDPNTGPSNLPVIPSDPSSGPPDLEVIPSDPDTGPSNLPNVPSPAASHPLDNPPSTHSLWIPTPPRPANSHSYIPHPPVYTPDASDLHSAPTNAPSGPIAGPVLTHPIKNWNSSFAPQCTGCVLEAYEPVTTFYSPNDTLNPWTSLVVTETVLTRFVTYFYNGTIDTVTSELTTVNQTKTVVQMTGTITHSTPSFFIHPTPGVWLEVDAGPTYVVYNNLIGGLDEPKDQSGMQGTMQGTIPTCAPSLTSVQSWRPTKLEDWNYFIATYTDMAPSPTSYGPVALPSKLIDFLKSDSDIEKQFRSSNIATCTLRPTPSLSMSPEPPTAPGQPTVQPPLPAIPGLPSMTTRTFLSTTLASTSMHVTRQGCLRCDKTNPYVPPKPTPKPDGEITDDNNNNNNSPPRLTPQPNLRPNDPPTDDSNNSPNDTPNNNPGDGRNGNSNNGPYDNSNDNPNNQPKPSAPSQPVNLPNLQPWPQQTQKPSITIGNQVLPVNMPRPTQNNDESQENKPLVPIMVIGTEAFKPGETKTINGVPVVAPSVSNNPHIIVDGQTIAYNAQPKPTGPPVLVVGDNTMTANPLGQFIMGTATLKPGGPAMVLDGSTLSLAPTGPIAIVNGVTQTLGNAPAPTAAPALTLGDGNTVPVTTINGQPAYIISPDQTLLPGTALTVSGITYSLPASGSGTIVVINGQTSTLAAPDAYMTAPPILTINGNTYPATVRDGTTIYILAPGTTLQPGQAVTVSGTTYSLDTAGTALVVDGETSRISLSRVPAGMSSSGASAAATTTTISRGLGDLIASGIGEGRSSSSRAAGVLARGSSRGVDSWLQGVVLGIAGWVLWLL